ncbi:MAG TPA: hypothetical protein VIL55_14750 [Naasia sp.]
MAVTLLPVSILIAIEEAIAPGAAAGHVLAAIAAENLAAALLGVPLGLWITRRRVPLPLGLVILVWAAIGALRGAAGAAVAAMSGLDPHLEHRVLYWTALAVVWMPLLGFFLAQLAHCRSLLSALFEAETARDEARERAERSVEQVRSELLFSIGRTVFPAIREVRDGLRRAGRSDAELSAIGARLTSLTAQVGATVDLVAEAAVHDHARPPRVPPAPLASALHFESRRPLRWAGLSGAALLIAALPVTLHAHRPVLTLHLLLAVVIGTGALAAGPGVVARWRSGQRFFPWVPVRYLTASAVPGVVLLVLERNSLDGADVLLIAALPVGFTYAAALTSGGMGCAGANRAIVGSLGLLLDEREHLEQAARAEEEQVRAGLRALLHGPIQGRLAACAMAINFHTAGTVDGAGLIGPVLDHLDLVEQDLAVIEAEILVADWDRERLAPESGWPGHL